MLACIWFGLCALLWFETVEIDGLVQDCSNSSALAVELLQFCTKPSKCNRNFIVNLRVIFCEVYNVTLSNIDKSHKTSKTLQWRHNGRDSAWNHQPHEWLLNRLFRRRSKKTSKLYIADLGAGNSPETGEFPTQMASNAKNVSIWWRHHEQWCNHWKTIWMGFLLICWDYFYLHIDVFNIFR